MVSCNVSTSSEPYGSPVSQVFNPHLIYLSFGGGGKRVGVVRWYFVSLFCLFFGVLVLRVEPQPSQMLDSTLSSELHRSQ